MFTQLLR